MRKIFLFLIVLILCGCSKNDVKPISLIDIGYSQQDAQIIETFPQEIIEVFMNNYNDKLLSLIYNEGFNIDNFVEYEKYIDYFETNKVIKLVNKKIINDSNFKFIDDVYKDDYYLSKNEDIYLEYLDGYDDARSLVEAINTKAYLPYYSDIKQTDLSKEYLILINKFNALPEDYEPDDLVEIDSYYGRGYVRSKVYDAYKKLQDDANASGYDFVICSAYRSYDYQKGLYEKYLNEDDGGQASVDTYSARPGHSEHQSGLCLDLSDSIYGMDDFGLSDSYVWIKDNCYRYGFIIRYTEDKESITGYEAEPWQIRYVGSIEIAKDIMDRKITFDEYYAYYVED